MVVFLLLLPLVNAIYGEKVKFFEGDIIYFVSSILLSFLLLDFLPCDSYDFKFSFVNGFFSNKNT